MSDEFQRAIQIAQPILGKEEWEALREPLETGWLTQGPKVAEFERMFAERHGVRYAIATTSCTTALHLILAALDIGPGDEVIVPSFTWVSTANAVRYCGATPIFADVERTTFNIDPSGIGSLVNSRTRAILVVHLFGLCADIDAISSAAPDIPIIEDAACAVGAEYKGTAAGGLGVAAAFSFHPRKIITTGEGGMISTNDDFLSHKLQMMRNHGASISEEQRHLGPKPYILPAFDEIGYNYRMTDLQGAIGIEQMKRLDGLLADRKRWAQFYQVQLESLPWLNVPCEPIGGSHSWQSFVCSVSSDSLVDRNTLMEKLFAKGINTRPGTHAVHRLGCYRQTAEACLRRYPNAEWCEEQSIALPLHGRMTDADYEYVVRCIKECNPS